MGSRLVERRDRARADKDRSISAARRTARAGGGSRRQEKRLVASGVVFQHGSPAWRSHDAVGCFGVGAVEHRPFDGVLLWPLDFLRDSIADSGGCLPVSRISTSQRGRILEGVARVKNFSDLGGAITLAGESIRGRKTTLPRCVRGGVSRSIDPGRVGPAAGRAARRAKDCRADTGNRRDRTARLEPPGRSMAGDLDQRMAVTAKIVVQVVDGDQDHVEPRRLGGTGRHGEIESQQQHEATQRARGPIIGKHRSCSGDKGTQAARPQNARRFVGFGSLGAVGAGLSTDLVFGLVGSFGASEGCGLAAGCRSRTAGSAAGTWRRAGFDRHDEIAVQRPTGRRAPASRLAAAQPGEAPDTDSRPADASGVRPIGHGRGNPYLARRQSSRTSYFPPSGDMNLASSNCSAVAIPSAGGTCSCSVEHVQEPRVALHNLPRLAIAVGIDRRRQSRFGQVVGVQPKLGRPLGLFELQLLRNLIENLRMERQQRESVESAAATGPRQPRIAVGVGRRARGAPRSTASSPGPGSRPDSLANRATAK